MCAVGILAPQILWLVDFFAQFADWRFCAAFERHADHLTADEIDAQVEARGAGSLLADVELPLERVLAEMERTGIAVDVDGLRALTPGLAVSKTINDPQGSITTLSNNFNTLLRASSSGAECDILPPCCPGWGFVRCNVAR